MNGPRPRDWGGALIGHRAVEPPAGVYYGAHTLRAMRDVPISGVPLGRYPELVTALACVKQAAALSNRDLGLLDRRKAAAIVAACEEIRSGRWHDQFVVDVIQDGAGGSTNMNANEVIANRALEYLGHARGDQLRLHPVDDVNLSQSTEDVYPTSVRLAVHFLIRRLLDAMAQLRWACATKADELADVVLAGQDGRHSTEPATLGAEFSGYRSMLDEDRRRLTETLGPILEVNLGTTAMRIGVVAHPGYPDLVRRRLAELTAVTFRPVPGGRGNASDSGAFVQLSGVLKGIAVTLSTICTDLRLLAVQPRAALGELVLPTAQPGSRLVPAHDDTAVPEMVNQIAFAVMGHDVTVGVAAAAGRRRDLFQPVIAHSLFQSLTQLRTGCQTLADRCVGGIRAHRIPAQRQRPVEPCLGAGEPAQVGPNSAIDTLSRREAEIAELVSRGHTNRHIASTLTLSPRTVETYVKRIFAKLGASSRSEVAAMIVRSGGTGPGRRLPECRHSDVR